MEKILALHKENDKENAQNQAEHKYGENLDNLFFQSGTKKNKQENNNEQYQLQE